MRFNLFFWFLLFILGVLIGERYGLPSAATTITDRGFELIEGRFGHLSEPIPTPEDEDSAPEADSAPAEDSTASEDSDASEVTEASENSDANEDTAEPASPAPAHASAKLGNEANAGLRMNSAGLQIIEESEGLRLEAYNLGGQWLIGYGHSRTARAGMTITKAQAEQLLREDVSDSENGVRKLVVVPMNENQFSAMVSLAYNLGTGGFSKTTVLEKINQGDYSGAGDAFLNHDRARVNGVLQSIPHLTERREKERALFLTPA
jgi:lysozyme